MDLARQGWEIVTGKRLSYKPRVKVLEAIQRGTQYLAARGVESPRLQAEWLLAHVLQVPRLQLYLQFDRELSAEQTDQARLLVVRRGRREPLQHLLGTVVFGGLELRVGPEALIPRPETELLAEAALGWLRTLPPGECKLLDFGTGTGCLILSLLARLEGATGCAVDLSGPALALARRNAMHHGLAERVRWYQGDGFAALPSGIKFSAIVANPPYIPTGSIADLEPEVREHDPRLALDGGADGLDFYRRLAREAGPWLVAGGRMFLELGDDQAGRVEDLLQGHKWIVEGITDDYSGRPRVLQACFTSSAERDVGGDAGAVN